MNKEQLKKMVEKCVYSEDGITYMSDKQYDDYMKLIEQLKDKWNKLKDYLLGKHDYKTMYSYVYDEIWLKMKELEKGEDNE